MISVIILNYKRPNILKKHILPFLDKQQLIAEIIVSHGIEKTAFYDSFAKVRYINDFSLQLEMAHARRYIRAKEVKSNFTLILDDDILPSGDTIFRLYDEIVKYPYCIHGTRGRAAKGGYKFANVYGNVPVLLGKLLLFPSEFIEYFWKHQTTVLPYVEAHSDHMWNGDDIFFCLAVLKETGVLHRAHRFKVKEFLLTQTRGISRNRFAHLARRKSFLTYCIDALDLGEFVEQC